MSFIFSAEPTDVWCPWLFSFKGVGSNAGRNCDMAESQPARYCVSCLQLMVCWCFPFFNVLSFISATQIWIGGRHQPEGRFAEITNNLAGHQVKIYNRKFETGTWSWLGVSTIGCRPVDSSWGKPEGPSKLLESNFLSMFMSMSIFMLNFLRTLFLVHVYVYVHFYVEFSEDIISCPCLCLCPFLC